MLELPEKERGDRWGNEDIRPVPPERQTWGTQFLPSTADVHLMTLLA